MELSKENQGWLVNNLVEVKTSGHHVCNFLERFTVREKILQDQQKIEELEKFKSDILTLYGFAIKEWSETDHEENHLSAMFRFLEDNKQ